MKTAFLLIVGFIFLLTSCGGNAPANTETPAIDSTVVEDTIEDISEEFLDYDFGEDEENDQNHSHSHSSSAASEFENYQRSGDSPKDFADAMIWHVVKMVYDEDFQSARSEVISDKLEDGRYTIVMKVFWSDRWVSGYELEGTLKVNEDGTNANFDVSGKNADAESLEFTHETKNSIELEQI